MCYYLKPFLCMMHLRMNGPLITGQTKRTCFGLLSLLPFKAYDFTVNEFSQSMFSFSCIFRKKVFLGTNNPYMSNTDNYGVIPTMVSYHRQYSWLYSFNIIAVFKLNPIFSIYFIQRISIVDVISDIKHLYYSMHFDR